MDYVRLTCIILRAALGIPLEQKNLGRLWLAYMRTSGRVSMLHSKKSHTNQLCFTYLKALHSIKGYIGVWMANSNSKHLLDWNIMQSFAIAKTYSWFVWYFLECTIYICLFWPLYTAKTRPTVVQSTRNKNRFHALLHGLRNETHTIPMILVVIKGSWADVDSKCPNSFRDIPSPFHQSWEKCYAYTNTPKFIKILI